MMRTKCQITYCLLKGAVAIVGELAPQRIVTLVIGCAHSILSHLTMYNRHLRQLTALPTAFVSRTDGRDVNPTKVVEAAMAPIVHTDAIDAIGVAQRLLAALFGRWSVWPFAFTAG